MQGEGGAVLSVHSIRSGCFECSKKKEALLSVQEEGGAVSSAKHKEWLFLGVKE
jgi:hypothetical protein